MVLCQDELLSPPLLSDFYSWKSDFYSMGCWAVIYIGFFIVLTIICSCQHYHMIFSQKIFKSLLHLWLSFMMVLVSIFMFSVHIPKCTRQWTCSIQFSFFYHLVIFTFSFLCQAGQEWWSLRNTTIWAENQTIWLSLQLKITGDRRRVTNVPPLLPPVSVKMSLLKIKAALCGENSVVEGDVRLSW